MTLEWLDEVVISLLYMNDRYLCVAFGWNDLVTIRRSIVRPIKSLKHYPFTIITQFGRSHSHAFSRSKHHVRQTGTLHHGNLWLCAKPSHEHMSTWQNVVVGTNDPGNSLRFHF